LNRRGALRIAGAVACLLFALSILYPFLQTGVIRFAPPPIGPPASFGPYTFWSFKAIYVFDERLTDERWFQDYWSAYLTSKPVNRPSEFGIEIGVVLILMFIAQCSTFIAAGLAISKVKPYMFLSAALLSLFTTLCMWLFSRLHAYFFSESTFQAGFWLTLPTAALFLATFIIGRADSRRSLSSKASASNTSQ